MAPGPSTIVEPVTADAAHPYVREELAGRSLHFSMSAIQSRMTTHVERKSRYLIAGKLMNKTAAITSAVTCAAFKSTDRQQPAALLAQVDEALQCPQRAGLGADELAAQAHAAGVVVA